MGEKDLFKERIEAQLKEWSARIDLLKAKADKVKADAKIEYSQEIESLKAKKELLKARLAEWQGARGEAWESIKSGVEKAAGELRDALEKAASRFK